MTAQPVNDASPLLLPGMPRLGFGCGDLFAGATQPQSTRLVQAALEAGIRYFDVARLYGNGSAEVVLGGVLPRMRDQVVIASKAGIVPWSMLLWRRLAHKAAKAVRAAGPVGRAIVSAPAPSAPLFGAFRPTDLARSVNHSLRALRTDYLDILLLHECSVADARKPEVLDFLEGLRTAGKIRSFGIATHFAETCQILTQMPKLAQVVQIASDALNHNVATLPKSQAALVVTHSAMKHALPRLLEHLASDPEARRRWTEGTGLAPDDRAGIARLLLSDAIAENPAGIVLFSSSRPERIAEAVSAKAAPGALKTLHQELEPLRVSRGA